MTISGTDAKPLRGARILIVNGNKNGLCARKMVLEDKGCLLTATTCPKQALELFVAQQFDLVITDYRMPVMKGDELIREVRASKPAQLVILISGVAEPLGLNEENTGADVVIQKSNTEVNQLLRAVERLLSRKPQRKPPGRQPPRRSAEDNGTR